MKFEIINRQFKDKTIETLIIKMFEYFATINAERLEKCKQSKSKEELLAILKDLAVYVESGLKKKFSVNFIVLISEHPNYAVKFEKFYFLGLKYKNFEIIVMKSPFICIPGKFSKYSSLKEEEKNKITKFYEEK